MRVQLQQFGAVFALYQHLDKIFRNMQHLLDLGHNAVGIQILLFRRLYIDILLRHQINAAVVVHCPLDGSNGFVTPHLKVNDIIREHNQPAHGDGGQILHIPVNFYSYLFCH